MDYKANVTLMTKPGSLKGVASVSINEEFVVKGLRIYEGDNGPFVSMPSRKVGEMLAKRATEKGIECCVFDRGGYIYHGRVQELAEGAREGGLKF